VINPDSGPGDGPTPDVNYTREITKLSIRGNVRLLGYVPTDYARRDISDVYQDIQTYANWPTAGLDPTLAVHGIFFDETPQQYDDASMTYLRNLTRAVKRKNGLGPDNFVSRPHTAVIQSYIRCILRFSPCLVLLSASILSLPMGDAISGSREILGLPRQAELTICLAGCS
jgi:hypothetical protein